MMTSSADVDGLLRKLVQPRSQVRRILQVNDYVWDIPSPGFTPYKNVYHGGEENEKREVLYKHLPVWGPEWMGELKLELSWHYWIMRLTGEFVVDQIRATVVSNRPNKLGLDNPSQGPSVPVSFSQPDQSWGPLTIPAGENTDLVQIPLRDVTIKATEQTTTTTYTFNLSFEYARRLKRRTDPDSFHGLFKGDKVHCSIGSTFTSMEQLIPEAEKAYFEVIALEKGEEDVRECLKAFKDTGDGKYRIKSEDREFYVVKEMLAKASPVFAACFEHPDTEEELSQTYTIPKYSSAAVQQFLWYCVTDRTLDLEKHVLEVVGLAHQYQTNDLLIRCEKILIRTVLRDEAIDMLTDISAIATCLSLPSLLVAIHLLVEEKMPYWSREELRHWVKFSAEYPEFSLERYQAVADMIASEIS